MEVVIMPEKDQFLYMDDGGPDEIPELSPEDEAFIRELEEKVKKQFPSIFTE